MPGFQTNIGNRFEDILRQDFPDFEPLSTPNIPDFFSKQGRFFIEAKVGYEEYGARLKQSQILTHRQLTKEFPDSPVVHVVGFHNFHGASVKLPSKTERGQKRVLKNQMSILQAYFISRQIIEQIWEKENFVAKETNGRYCMVKQRFLRNIIDNSSFRRRGIEQIADEYYEIDRDKFLLTHLGEPYNDFPYGALLHKDQDKRVINYLVKKRSHK